MLLNNLINNTDSGIISVQELIASQGGVIKSIIIYDRNEQQVHTLKGDYKEVNELPKQILQSTISMMNIESELNEFYIAIQINY